MTPADRFFDQPPEMSVLGPLGSFRVFGTLGNDFATENQYYSWTDNLAWVHGSHKTRAGGFFLTQTNWRDDPGAARGKGISLFQTFSDFLLGLSADGNLSPSGRSNIQSVQASEGVGPRGQVQYHYRSYQGAGYVQDDFKWRRASRSTWGCVGSTWGPALDTTGAIGNACPCPARARRPSRRPRARSPGKHGGRQLRSRLINPYTGQPFGPPPAGARCDRARVSTRTAPRSIPSPRASAWRGSPSGRRTIPVRGGYGWFYQTIPDLAPARPGCGVPRAMAGIALSLITERRDVVAAAAGVAIAVIGAVIVAPSGGHRPRRRPRPAGRAGSRPRAWS